jgi:hypothetical protein
MTLSQKPWSFAAFLSALLGASKDTLSNICNLGFNVYFIRPICAVSDAKGMMTDIIHFLLAQSSKNLED